MRSLEETSACDGFEQYLPDAFSSFPSPASVAESRSAQNLSRAVTRTLSYSDQLTPHDGLFDGRGIPTVPGDVRHAPAMSPFSDEAVEPDMNILVGGALAPIPMDRPRPPLSPRVGPGLRLPSFERLGIAAPHPDRVGGIIRNDTTGSRRAEDSCARFRGHDIESTVSARMAVTRVESSIGEGAFNPDIETAAGRTIRPPLQQYVNTITPPAEKTAPSWDVLATVEIPGMHSPSSEPANTASTPGEVQAPTQTPTVEVAPHDDNGEATGDTDSPSWIDGAVDVLLGNLRFASRTSDSLKILSHALPITSTSGHVFTKVITAINVSTPASPITPLTWINVFHAIPGRFNLADLPTSPPTTPGPAVGGDDYFTQKIFDSAVSISDYQDDVTSMPRSPRPIVPPSSIDVSIVERYIPPSSSNEFSEMFDPNGSSILVDRLVELSSENGSLLFIYPTRTGAQTFMRDYLGPILDPLLRTMVVVHSVSSDLCISLGNMAAVQQLLEYESLQHRISALCARLSQHNTGARRFHGRRPLFTLSYASKQCVKLQRGVWAREWWTKQEKTRLKETINNHYRESQTRRSSISEFSHQSASPTVLLQELLDGVSGKPTQEQVVNDSAIEVGCFVITRSE